MRPRLRSGPRRICTPCGAVVAPPAHNPIDTGQAFTIAAGVAAGVVVAELAIALFRKIKAGA